MDAPGFDLHWSDPTLRLRVGTCLRSRTGPGWSVGAAWSRWLRDFDLWVVADGRGRLRHRGPSGGGVPSGEVRLAPGVAVLLRPGGAYEATQEPGRPMTIDAVHFDVLDAAGVRPPGAALSLPPLALPVPDLGHAEACARRLRDRAIERGLGGGQDAEDPIAAVVLRALLLDLEDAAAADRDPADAAARLHRRVTARAEARIRERLADPPTVAELAAEAGFSPDHFGRVFKRVSGRSPGRARVLARTERAKHLLRTTAMTVSEVAAALGYRDVHFFSRQFKSETGQPPTAHRLGGSPPPDDDAAAG